MVCAVRRLPFSSIYFMVSLKAELIYVSVDLLQHCLPAGNEHDKAFDFFRF